MGTEESLEPAARGSRKSEFDWDSPPGKALAELFESLTTIRTLRRVVNDAVASVNRLEFQLRASILEVKKITPKLRPEAATSESNSGGLLTQMEVAEKLGISSASLLARIREWPPFPEPIHVSSRKIAYRARDIEDWVQSENKRLATK